MTGWTLTIPEWVPDSGLSLNGRRRATFWDVRKMQQAAKLVVGLHLVNERISQRYGRLERAHVSICFIYPIRRRRDPDGLAGLAKPCLDGMVDAGVIRDDDCEHITLSISASVEAGVTETRLVVEPWELDKTQAPDSR